MYKKRYIKKRRNTSKKLNQNKSYSFSRYYTSKQPITLSAGLIEQGASYQFQLNLLQNYTDFTTLYDQYQIVSAIMYVRLLSNPDNSGSAPAVMPQIFPTLWYIPDYDDASTVTLAQIKQHQGVKRRVLKPNQQLTIRCSPKMAMEAYNGITSAFVQQKGKQWVDCDSPGVPHYGLKFVLDLEGVPQFYNYYVSTETKLIVRMRGTV